MLLNLVENALTATAGGGEVGVEVMVDAAGAAVAVRDNGVGISPDDLSRIFEDGFTTASGEKAPWPAVAAAATQPRRLAPSGPGVGHHAAPVPGGWRSPVRNAQREAGRGSVFVIWLPRPRA